MDKRALELGDPAPFVVGMGRSGTTLLRLILDSHSVLAVPPETDFPEALTCGSEISDDAALRAFRRHRDWRSFGIDSASLHAALKARPSPSAGEALRCFYRTYASRFGKSRWGDKTPAYVTRFAEPLRPAARGALHHPPDPQISAAGGLPPCGPCPSRPAGRLSAYGGGLGQPDRRRPTPRREHGAAATWKCDTKTLCASPSVKSAGSAPS